MNYSTLCLAHPELRTPAVAGLTRDIAAFPRLAELTTDSVAYALVAL